MSDRHVTWALEIVRADSRSMTFFCDEHGRQMAAESGSIIVDDSTVLRVAVTCWDTPEALLPMGDVSHECRTCRRAA